MFRELVTRTDGTTAMVWAMLFMLALLAGLSCLTVAGRLSAG